MNLIGNIGPNKKLVSTVLYILQHSLVSTKFIPTIILPIRAVVVEFFTSADYLAPFLLLVGKAFNWTFQKKLSDSNNSWTERWKVTDKLRTWKMVFLLTGSPLDFSACHHFYHPLLRCEEHLESSVRVVVMLVEHYHNWNRNWQDG